MEGFFLFTDGGGFIRPDKDYNGVSNFRFFGEDKELIHRSAFICEHRTNNWGEINAITRGTGYALAYVEANKPENFTLNIVADSLLCIKSLTEWIFGWMKKARKKQSKTFMSSEGAPVANQEEIKQAFKNLQDLRKLGAKVNLYHLKSHVSKKKVDKLKTYFEKFNKIKVTDEEFLFIYLQNRKCDDEVKLAYEYFVTNKIQEW